MKSPTRKHCASIATSDAVIAGSRSAAFSGVTKPDGATIVITIKNHVATLSGTSSSIEEIRQTVTMVSNLNSVDQVINLISCH